MANRSRQGSHAARVGRRRRQENTVAGRTRRRKVRLTVAEDEALAARAAAEGVSVPRLLLEQALAEDVGVTLEERRERAGGDAHPVRITRYTPGEEAHRV